MRSFIKIILLAVLLPLIILFPFSLKGQEDIAAVSDSISPEPESIELSNISIRSGEVLIELKERVESLITWKEIEQLRIENDSVLNLIDSLLSMHDTVPYRAKNIRFLNNISVYWQDVAANFDDEKSYKMNLIQQMDEEIFEMGEEAKIWKKTKIILEKRVSSRSVITRIDQILFKLDSVEALIRERSELLLFQLDKITRKELLIKDHISNIDDHIKNKTDDLFFQNQPPIWAMDFNSKKVWSLSGLLEDFYKMEITGLKKYYERNVPNFILQFILLILLIIIFPIIKRRLQKNTSEVTSFYQKNLLRSLSHPISSALILGLFASIVILPNRPLLLKDLSRLIIIIPLIIIVINLTSKKFNKYFYIFGGLALLQFFSFLLPPGHGLYVLSIMVIAMVELFTLIQLFRYSRRNPLEKKVFSNLIGFVLAIHIGFAIVGLAGIIVGATILAELTIHLVLLNTLASILIATSAIIINGLIEVGIASPAVQKLNFIHLYGDSIRKRIVRLINFLAVLFLLKTMLQIINLYDIVFDSLTSLFTDTIRLGSLSFTLGGVILFFLVIWLSVVISNMIRVILEKDVLDKLNLGKGIPHTIAVMVKYTLVTVGFLLAVSAAGLPLSSLTVLFGAFGIGIGFGLQNIFNNLVSGLILLFERPIQIDDTIEVGQLMGNVKSIGIRSSNVRTFDGAEVIVPNGLLISKEVVNWTLSDQRRRIEVLAGVAYGSDPYKVKSLFEEILDKHPDIIHDPKPLVLFNDLGESSLDFRLLFWTSNFSDWIRIKSEIVFQVHDILYKEGIEIPFPQRDLHVRSMDEKISIIKSEEKEKEG